MRMAWLQLKRGIGGMRNHSVISSKKALFSQNNKRLSQDPQKTTEINSLSREDGANSWHSRVFMQSWGPVSTDSFSHRLFSITMQFSVFSTQGNNAITASASSIFWLCTHSMLINGSSIKILLLSMISLLLYKQIKQTGLLHPSEQKWQRRKTLQHNTGALKVQFTCFVSLLWHNFHQLFLHILCNWDEIKVNMKHSECICFRMFW